jgi:hypothetical protein
MQQQAKDDEILGSAVSLTLRQLFNKQTGTCQMRTLSEVIEAEKVERIDLLKIDVEKSEHQVLAGLDEAHWSKIHQAIVEVHDFGERVGLLKALFERHNFQVRVEQDKLFQGTDIYSLFAKS